MATMNVSVIPDQERWLASLDAAIERGLADVAAGRVTDASAVFDRLEEKYRTMARTPEAR